MQDDKRINKILSNKFDSQKSNFDQTHLWEKLESTLDKEASYVQSEKRNRLFGILFSILVCIGIFSLFQSNLKDTEFAQNKDSKKIKSNISESYLSESSVTVFEKNVNQTKEAIPNNEGAVSVLEKSVKLVDRIHNISSKIQDSKIEISKSQESDNDNIQNQIGNLVANSFMPTRQSKSPKSDLFESNDFRQIEKIDQVSLLGSLDIPEIKFHSNYNVFLTPSYSRGRQGKERTGQIILRTEALFSEIKYIARPGTDPNVERGLERLGSRTGYAHSISYMTVLKNNLAFSLGLESLVLRERFENTVSFGSTSGRMTIDTAFYRIVNGEREYSAGEVEVECDSIHHVAHTNKHHYFNIIASTGYKFALNKSNFLCLAEYGFNISHSYSGRLIDSQIRISNVENMKELQVQRINGILGLRLMIDHPFSDKVSLGAHIALRKTLGSGFNLLDEKIGFLSGGLSLNYRL